MSAASRFENAGRCFVARDPETGRFVKTCIDAAKVDAASSAWPSLALNRAAVPGGLGYELAAPVVAGGVQWVPEDAGPFGCPIGAALAAELAGVAS